MTQRRLNLKQHPSVPNRGPRSLLLIRPSRLPRRGGTVLLVLVLLVLILGMVAVAVDVGRMFLVRSQLQTAVDAGALAAGLVLKDDPDDLDGAVASAREFVQRNRVGWLVTVAEDAITVEAGKWDATTRLFTAGTTEPNAVRVAAAQNNEQLVFAWVFGISTFSVPRRAIATTSGEKLDIMMTLDLSGSMADEGRIEALRAAAPVFTDFVKTLGGDDRVGVMGYGALIGSYDPVKRGHLGTMYLAAPKALYPSKSDWVGVLEHGLTTDLDRVTSRALSPQSLLAGKYNDLTPTGAAIRDSAHYLNAQARPDAKRIMVLMSDGLANRPTNGASQYALKMAAYAKSLNIKIYTISLGSEADEQLMANIAAATDGRHFHAAGTDRAALTESLSTAFRGIGAAMQATQLVQ